MKKLIPFTIILVLVLINGCSDLGDAVTDPGNGGNGGSSGIDFISQVLPIFQTSCTVCHSGAVLNGNLDLSSYASLMAGTSNHGPVVIANDADNSYLIWSLEGTNGALKMPQGGSLNPSQIDLIRQWITEGALESAPGNGGNSGGGNVTFTENILPVLQTCVPCHTQPNPVNGLDFSTYESLMDDNAHDQVIDPFDPDGSELYRKITEDDPNDRMPPLPYEALAQTVTDNFHQWINEGAQNN